MGMKVEIDPDGGLIEVVAESVEDRKELCEYFCLNRDFLGHDLHIHTQYDKGDGYDETQLTFIARSKE